MHTTSALPLSFDSFAATCENLQHRLALMLTDPCVDLQEIAAQASRFSTLLAQYPDHTARLQARYDELDEAKAADASAVHFVMDPRSNGFVRRNIVAAGSR